jgi:5-methylcytosine-specific restriction endonuclease McrA
MSKISKKLDKEIRLEAKNRCGYCLGEQKYILAWLEVEHIQPRAKGGKTVKENLWLACTFCNTFKSSNTHARDPKTKRKTLLFNPRKQKWRNHFEFDRDGATIIGKTVCRRATVIALKN